MASRIFYDSEAEYDDVNDYADRGDGSGNDDDNNTLECQEDLSKMPVFSYHIMRLMHQHFGLGSNYVIYWGDNMVTPPLMDDGMLMR